MDLRTIPIFLAFFLMGLADAMGPQSDKIKEAYKSERHGFDLADNRSLRPSLPFFSVPGGLLAARIGKKLVTPRIGTERGRTGRPVYSQSLPAQPTCVSPSPGLHFFTGRRHHLSAGGGQSDHARRKCGGRTTAAI